MKSYMMNVGKSSFVRNHHDVGNIMETITAELGHAREIIDWFPDKESVIRWGSPHTRYPLREETFLEDIYWGRISSRVALTRDGGLLGFGQYYAKLGRCHLARLVINPEFRGQGLGEEFVEALMKFGALELDTNDFSLFVMTANRPAYNCYRRLGFVLADYPEGDAKLENCVFMVADWSG
jgi:ribosomal protein S18 acetylase RimI-like enzyme